MRKKTKTKVSEVESLKRISIRKTSGYYKKARDWFRHSIPFAEVKQKLCVFAKEKQLAVQKEKIPGEIYKVFYNEKKDPNGIFVLSIEEKNMHNLQIITFHISRIDIANLGVSSVGHLLNNVMPYKRIAESGFVFVDKPFRRLGLASLLTAARDLTLSKRGINEIVYQTNRNLEAIKFAEFSGRQYFQGVKKIPKLKKKK